MTLGPGEPPLQVFLIAGEASGDRLGAALMRGLRAELIDAGPEGVGGAAFHGVGGAAMAAEGLQSLFPISEIAVMGLAEVLPRLPTILKRIRETTEAVIASRPDVVVTIDAPDFGLRVSRRAGAALGDATTFVHYVAPSVWAWRPKRAEKMARSTDHLLALLPFEPPYFHRVGLSCDFVGHPIVEASAGVDPDDRSIRAEIGVAPDAPLIIALPGSRRGEVERLAP
ncbi:MAG: lipid-A-disaccharide synthase, partial [Pseudomonadota bacterium]